MKKTTRTMTNVMIRRYSELIRLPSFNERFEYLKVPGIISAETFGPYRYLYQDFLKGQEWRNLRHQIITRDLGCDLGVPGYDIHGLILIHHLNPIEKEDIINKTEYLLNPEYLISCSKRTHNAIHYGVPGEEVYSHMNERTPGDTCLWKRRT